MKIEGKVIAETDVKRFYLPGIKLIDQCPECEEEQIWNGSSDYLSYPYIGKPIHFDFYCQRLTIDGAGVGRTFTPETLSLSSVTITADQRLVASYDFHDLVAIQSMIDPVGSRATEVRQAMVQAISNQLNTYLYSLSAPTTTIPSVATMTAATVASARETAATLKWGYNKPWYGLLAPQYYSDLLVDTTFTSADFVGGDAPVISGQIGLKRYGFNIFEDNTQTAGATAGGLFFHPDYLYMVSQYEPRFKISDKHSQHEFAYVMSVDWVIGAKIGIQGAARHIKVQTGA